MEYPQWEDDCPGAVDYGPKPVYFLRLLVKPRNIEKKKTEVLEKTSTQKSQRKDDKLPPQAKANDAKGMESTSNSHKSDTKDKQKAIPSCKQDEEEKELVLVDAPNAFTDIVRNNPVFTDSLWQ
ncbi:hypothetical protein BJV82DRAFT_580748 [Fennellomyces sp. T-0311]|nr:hypothetical protein BJV82DRAFT_580748 [Fennellomyces sp. T-0311]